MTADVLSEYLLLRHLYLGNVRYVKSFIAIVIDARREYAIGVYCLINAENVEIFTHLNKNKMEEMILTSDNNAHSYLIPAALEEEFDTRIEYDEADWEGTDFNKYLYNRPLRDLIIRDYEIRTR